MPGPKGFLSLMTGAALIANHVGANAPYAWRVEECPMMSDLRQRQSPSWWNAARTNRPLLGAAAPSAAMQSARASATGLRSWMNTRESF